MSACRRRFRRRRPSRWAEHSRTVGGRQDRDRLAAGVDVLAEEFEAPHAGLRGQDLVLLPGWPTSCGSRPPMCFSVSRLPCGVEVEVTVSWHSAPSDVAARAGGDAASRRVGDLPISTAASGDDDRLRALVVGGASVARDLQDPSRWVSASWLAGRPPRRVRRRLAGRSLPVRR